MDMEDIAGGTEGNVEKGYVAHLVGRDSEDPSKVLPIARLLSNVRALKKLMTIKEPPRVQLRAREVLQALYLPGDASGSGFGSAVIGTKGIMYESRTWKEDWTNESSNLREAGNLVIKIEALVKEGKIQGQEVFLFTDNSTFEFMYYKGYSSSWKLSAIILRLYQAIRYGDMILHVIHVAGTRMKAWGVDRLSRCNLLEGMMSGEDLLSFIPLVEGANEQSQGKVGAWC